MVRGPALPSHSQQQSFPPVPILSHFPLPGETEKQVETERFMKGTGG